MVNVKLFFKLVKTGDFVPGGSDGYSAEKSQTIEDLKTDVASFYDLANLTTSWLLRHKKDNGSILLNLETIESCGLQDNDVLFIQDPELVRISCIGLSQTRVVWAYRTDSINSVKTEGFPSRATGSLVIGGVRVKEDSLVHSLVDNISLNITDWSPSTPRTITSGLKEGRYRLWNPNHARWLNVGKDSTCLDVLGNASTGTYFDVELTDGGVGISYMDNFTSIRRYLTIFNTGDEHNVALSTRQTAWTVRSVNATTFRILWGEYYLASLNTALSRPRLIWTHPGYPVAFSPDFSLDWNFVV